MMAEQHVQKSANVFTKKGFHELEEKLDYYISVRRNEIAEQIAVARGFGDLSENAEYDEAKKEQAALESKIVELENAIRTAIVIDDEDITTDKVSVGTLVRIRDMETGDEEEYSIVGGRESDPDTNRISNESPMGAALLGAKKGDQVTVDAPAGALKFTVLDIRRQ